jgi:hypothetical protein
MSECGVLGGYAEWPCVRDRDHDDLHRDGIGREFDGAVWVPVIDANKITTRHAEKVLDGYHDSGEVDIDGVKVAFYRDPFDKEFVWFFNPGDEPDEGDDERVIAQFKVERTLVRV